MKTGLKCQHPDGTIYEYVTGYCVVRHPHFGLLQYLDNSKNGVWINRLDGVRIFRPNDFEGYEHILPLEPGPNDIFLAN